MVLKKAERRGLSFLGHSKKVLLVVGSAKHNPGKGSESGLMNLALTSREQIR